MIDRAGRKIDYLRISVTDKCNLRCIYCMPREGVKFECNEEKLSFYEILKVVKASASIGISKIRITGGEPLVRENIEELIKDIKSTEGIKEVGITTNGIFLEEKINDLCNAGLDRVNISLDTLNRERFFKITGVNKLENVLRAIELSLVKGLTPVKINVVVMKEINFDEIMNFVALAEELPVSIRFIELMPIGQGAEIKPVSNGIVKEHILNFRNLHPYYENKGWGPASYYKTEKSKGSIGFISPISHEFCSTCNRIRLTSEGFLKLCLHWNKGIDLKEILRSGIDDEELKKILTIAIKNKPEKHNFRNEREIIIKEEKYDDRKMFQIGG